MLSLLTAEQGIQLVDTFCYIWIVFLSYLNTFKAVFLQKIDKAKKVLFKIDILLGKKDLQVRSRLYLFDSLILSNLLNDWESWVYENIEQIEVFHGNVLRRILEIRISEPKAMVYGELGRHKIKFPILNRTINFWKKLLNHPIRCHALFFVG